MKKQNILIILAIFLVLILIGYLVYIKQNSIDIITKDTTTTTKLTTTTNLVTTTTTIATSTTTINKNQFCELENCHGLDIKCGPNPPSMCTMEYAMGDRCLQYAKCDIQNGKCQQILNPQFLECKACIQICINTDGNDGVNKFECESKCK